MRIEKKTLNDALRVLGKVVAQISLPSRVCLIIAAFSGQRMSSIKRSQGSRAHNSEIGSCEINSGYCSRYTSK